MKNKSKKQVESINNSSKKLLLSDVSKSVCANCLKDLTMHYLCLSCLNNRHKQTVMVQLAYREPVFFTGVGMRPERN